MAYEGPKPEYDVVHTIKLGDKLAADISCRRGSRPRMFSFKPGSQGMDGSVRVNIRIFIGGQGRREIDYSKTPTPAEVAQLYQLVYAWCLTESQLDEDKFIASKANKEEKSKPRNFDDRKKKYDGPRRKGDSRGRGQSNPQDFEG